VAPIVECSLTNSLAKAAPSPSPWSLVPSPLIVNFIIVDSDFKRVWKNGKCGKLVNEENGQWKTGQWVISF
jgi:hypothetical protein